MEGVSHRDDPEVRRPTCNIRASLRVVGRRLLLVVRPFSLQAQFA
ncbi:hypothetical protein TPY_2521 [Sulfobacillus acidophilus TPY]|nr:hypothetical protein TPY_2521 [Sulfobacillus acidophilus TPY]